MIYTLGNGTILHVLLRQMYLCQFVLEYVDLRANLKYITGKQRVEIHIGHHACINDDQLMNVRDEK